MTHECYPEQEIDITVLRCPPDGDEDKEYSLKCTDFPEWLRKPVEAYLDFAPSFYESREKAQRAAGNMAVKRKKRALMEKDPATLTEEQLSDLTWCFKWEIFMSELDLLRASRLHLKRLNQTNANLKAIVERRRERVPE